MSEKSVAFKSIKSAYVAVLVLGIVCSALLLAIGLYALCDQSSNSALYQNLMKYYGINQDNFEPVINGTHSVTSIDYHINQSVCGSIMVFVAIVSLVFESIALFGVIKENLFINTSILLVMIVSMISALFTTKAIELYSFATHLIFILLTAVYVIVLNNELNTKRVTKGDSPEVSTCRSV